MPPGGCIARFAGNSVGGVTQLIALAVPAVLMLAASAVDLASVSSDRLLVQDTADSAALAAAKELSLSDPSGVGERAQAFSHSKLSALSDRLSYRVDVKPADDGGSVTVSISGVRKSFFGNMLPPGGWKIGASATATIMGRTPLCLLGAGRSGVSDLVMDDRARITAPGCLVHVNADIEVKKQAFLSAEIVQSSGETTGTVSPAPQVGAPEIDDPFGGINFGPPHHCDVNLPMLLAGTGLVELTPGAYCGTIQAMKKQTLKLKPGVYYFKKGARLELLEDSTLLGEDVVLIFDKGSDFRFKERSTISLKGRRQGVYAGFVLATARGNTATFEISSSSARELLGAIYIPDAILMIDGKDKIADQSAWTVVVAKAIKMRGSPSLVINSNYAGSTIAPPDGVGPNATDVRLTE